MKCYVTGGTGFVGSNIVKLFSEWHGIDVVSAARSAPTLPQPGRFAAVDMLDPASIRDSIRSEHPDFVVHSAILNDFAGIYADRKAGWYSYVDATRSVIDAANDVEATVVLVSTDWVFDGTQGNAAEDEPPNPINLYGFLKAAAEIVTIERAHRPIVARIAGVNGIHWAQPHAPRAQDAGFGYFVASLVDALSVGDPFTVWESDDINLRATPSLASESAEMMLGLVTSGARGTFHCCGGESVSRMELAHLAADVFELDAGLIRSGPPPEAALPGGSVPRDTSLRAQATADTISYELPSVTELLTEFRAQRETGNVRPVNRKS